MSSKRTLGEGVVPALVLTGVVYAVPAGKPHFGELHRIRKIHKKIRKAHKITARSMSASPPARQEGPPDTGGPERNAKKRDRNGKITIVLGSAAAAFVSVFYADLLYRILVR